MTAIAPADGALASTQGGVALYNGMFLYRFYADFDPDQPALVLRATARYPLARYPPDYVSRYCIALVLRYVSRYASTYSVPKLGDRGVSGWLVSWCIGGCIGVRVWSSGRYILYRACI